MLPVLILLSENKNIPIEDIWTIFYNVVMIALCIYMWIMTTKMNALHKERMALVEELSVLMDQVQRDRDSVLRDLAKVKSLRDDLEGMGDALAAAALSPERPSDPPA